MQQALQQHTAAARQLYLMVYVVYKCAHMLKYALYNKRCQCWNLLKAGQLRSKHLYRRG